MLAVSWASSARAASMSSLARADLRQSLRLVCELGVRFGHGQLSGVLGDVLLADRPGRLFQLLVPRVIALGLGQRRLLGGGLGPRLGDLLRPRSVFELRQGRREIIAQGTCHPQLVLEITLVQSRDHLAGLHGVSFVHSQRLDAAVDLEGEVDLAYIDISLEIQVCLFFSLPHEDVPRCPGQSRHRARRAPASAKADDARAVPSSGRLRSRAALQCSGWKRRGWA